MPILFVFIVASTLLSVVPVQADDCVSTGTTSSWIVALTWDNCTGGNGPVTGTPGAGDTATIEHFVEITGDMTGLINDITISTLTINNGGILRFDDMPRSLTVTGNVTINAGGTFGVQVSGAATHTMTIGGNLSNAGTFEMYPDTDRVCHVTFNNSGPQTISGSKLNFANITVDMGSSPSNILDVQAMISMADDGLTLTNGTFQLSSASTIKPFVGAEMIPSTAGYYLNHMSAISNYSSSGSLTVNGTLRVAAGEMNAATSNSSLICNGTCTVTGGTLNIGSNSGNRLEVNGSLNVQGGTLDIKGRYLQESGSTATFSGGTTNVATDGLSGTTTLATFDVQGGASFTMSDGVVRIHNANPNYADHENSGGGLKISGTSSITGGTFILGNNSSTSGNIEIDVNDSIFNLEIDADSTTPTVLAGTTLDINGTFTVTSGSLVLENGTAMLTTSTPSGVGTEMTTRTISGDGDAGWRMLSAPVASMSISDITDDTPIQGFGDGAEKNFYTGHDGTDWTAPADLSGTLTTGQGFILYFFDNNQAGSSPLPVTLGATGAQPSDPVVSLHSNGSGFNLIGSPFGHDIDMNLLVGTGAAVPNVGQTWEDGAGNPNPGETSTGSYVMTSANNDEVAYWQGVFLENVNGATAVTIPNAAKTGIDASFFKTGTTASAERRLLQLTLAGHDVATGVHTWDEAAILYFASNATTGWDRWDVSKLTPLAVPFATLAISGERDGAAVLKAQESRPYDLDAEIEIPISLTTYDMVGDFTIAWPTLETLPSDWHLVLIDHEENREVDLRQEASYTFTLSADKTTRSLATTFAALEAVAGRPVTLASDDESRFTLRMTPSGVGTDRSEEADFPEGFVLRQNYPNPFNPVTNIEYAMPKAGPVRLVVYNALGRQVAILADGWHPAGQHIVTWDATNQASGVYFYRLEGDRHMLTRTMLLLK